MTYFSSHRVQCSCELEVAILLCHWQAYVERGKHIYVESVNLCGFFLAQGMSSVVSSSYHTAELLAVKLLCATGSALRARILSLSWPMKLCRVQGLYCSKIWSVQTMPVEDWRQVEP